MELDDPGRQRRGGGRRRLDEEDDLVGLLDRVLPAERRPRPGQGRDTGGQPLLDERAGQPRGGGGVGGRGEDEAKVAREDLAVVAHVRRRGTTGISPPPNPPPMPPLGPPGPDEPPRPPPPPPPDPPSPPGPPRSPSGPLPSPRPSTFTSWPFDGRTNFALLASVWLSTSRRRMTSARSLKYVSAALETSLIASASALARSTRAWASPSARRMSPWRTPSACRIWLCLMPSDSRIEARLSRSAFICRDIASVMSTGGSIFCTSTRVTLTPHRFVASSSTRRRFVLIMSRATSVSSSVRSPIRLRRLVWASVVQA